MVLIGFFKTSYLMGSDEMVKPSLFWAVLYNFLDTGNQTSATTDLGRYFALFLALAGSIFMNGLLVSAIIGWYDRFVDKWRCGLARYDEILRTKKCIVIIGANETVPSLIRQLIKKYNCLDYVVVQTMDNVENVRSRFVSYLKTEEERKVIIYSGDRTSVDDIKDLHLNSENTLEVFIIGDCLEDYNHGKNSDALNLNCLHIIAEQIRNYYKCSADDRVIKKMLCRVMFEHQASFSIFQHSDISNDIKDIIDFRPVNFYELWAQRTLVNSKLEFQQDDENDYLPLEGMEPLKKDSCETVHLVIIGMSDMGIAMAIEAARISHYPNFINNNRLKTRITFIDRCCHKEMVLFQGRFKDMFSLAKWRELSESENIYKVLSDSDWNNKNVFDNINYLGDDFIDIEWEFVNRGIGDADLYEYLKKCALCNERRLTIAICFPNDNINVSAALYLPDEVYKESVQILVYQHHNSSIIDSISKNNKSNLYYKRLKAFGMVQDAYNIELIDFQEAAAKIIENSYKKSNGKKTEGGVNKGKSEITKFWSNIYNANSIWTKLRSVGYVSGSEICEEDLKLLAETEHNRWIIEQFFMHYRCLSYSEQRSVLKGESLKNELIYNKRAHLDICSYNRLEVIDPESVYVNKNLVDNISHIASKINNIYKK